MKKIYTLLFTLLLFTSCSCEKQMYRLSLRCPDLFAPKHIVDTTIIESFRHDTAFVFSQSQTDTFYITKDRVEVMIIRQTDTLQALIYIPADTIYKEIVVEVPKPVKITKNPFFQNVSMLVYSIFAFLIFAFGTFSGIMIIKMIKK